MNHFTIYHNPRCSKSRQALEILQSHSIHPTIIEYLKTPLNLDEIMKLRSHFDLKDFIRQDEAIFKELELNLNNETDILHALLKEPILMQRPIITYGEKAIIARPPEKVLALIVGTPLTLEIATIRKHKKLQNKGID
jgi:arsenate reductase